MSKRQLVLLFVTSLSLYTGNGLLMIFVPVYAARLGVPAGLIGYLMALAFLLLVCGSMVVGLVYARVGHARLLILACVGLPVPLIALVGQVTRAWQLAGVVGGAWLLAGGAVPLLNIVAGLQATPEQRGRVFGILGTTVGLAGVLGGSTFGPVADRWGYPVMFLVCAGTLLPGLIAALLLNEPAAARRTEEVVSQGRPVGGLGPAFYLLLVASVLAGFACYAGGLSRSLALQRLGFSATAIGSTGIVQGFVSIPLPFLAGWLSDRAGRKRVLLACYLVMIAYLLVQASAQALWHFWVAVALSAALNISQPVVSCFTTDLVPRESLARAMAPMSAATFAGGILGMAATGNAIESFGVVPTLLAAAALPIVASVLVAAIRGPSSSLAPALQAG